MASVITITADYNIDPADEIILVDPTVLTTLTLPPIVPCGKRFYIKDIAGSAGLVKIDAGIHTIDNDPDFTFSTPKQSILAHFGGDEYAIL